MGSAGILKSTDAGQSWTVSGPMCLTRDYPQPAGQFPQYQAVGKVRVDPRNSNNIVAGTKTGLFFSYDGGNQLERSLLTNAFTAPSARTSPACSCSDNGTGTRPLRRGRHARLQPHRPARPGRERRQRHLPATLPASGCPASWTLLSRAGQRLARRHRQRHRPSTSQAAITLGRIDIAIAPSNPQRTSTPRCRPSRRTAAVRQLSGCQLGFWRTTDGGVTWTAAARPDAR